MEDQIARLRRDIGRYERLRMLIAGDPTVREIERLLEEAKERLRDIERRD